MEEGNREMEKVFKTTLFLWHFKRIPPAGEPSKEGVLHRAREEDITVISAAHRDAKLVKARLDAGCMAYWLEIDGACAHVLWYATRKHFVWDLRCELLLSQDAVYLFDVFTAPAFRQRGLFRASFYRTFAFLEDAHIRRMYTLIRTDNTAPNMAGVHFGGDRLATVSLAQYPPLRRYRLMLEDGEKRDLFRLMRIRTRPATLDLDNLVFTK